jgi:exopolyphosphatase/pppGpp-phosphohydrolase
MKEIDVFEMFWENSKLNPYNIRLFAKKLDEDIKQFHSTSHLFYPTEDLVLQKPADSLSKIMQKRKSERVFNNYEMSEKEMSSLFMSFIQKEDSTRVIPSA